MTNIGRVTSATGGGSVSDVVPSATGNRAQAKAAEHDAASKIIVQPLSEILKLPDVTVAQAIERLPGVSLETDSGEGRFINLRGLDADLNSTTFGDVRVLPSNLSSPQGGGRAVAYDALPVGLIGGIELKETLRPEDDAEGIGGEINLIPRRQTQNGAPFFEGTLGSGVETLRGTSVTDYGFTTGFSFGLQSGDGPFASPPPTSGWISNPRPFSIIFTDSQHNDYRGVDDYEPSYNDQQSAGAPDKLLSGVNLRHYLYNRRRFDRGAEFDFDPNDTDHFFFRYAEAGYNEHAGKDFLNFSGLDSGFSAATPRSVIDPADPTGNTFLAPQATAQRTNTDTEEEVRNQILTWGGSNVLFDRLGIDYRGAYSVGSDKFPTAYNSSFQDPNPISLAYNDSSPNGLKYSTLDGTDLRNTNNYLLQSVVNTPSSSRDREWSGAADATYPFRLLTPDDQIKVGAILRLRDRIVQTTTNSPSIPASDVGLPLSDFVGNNDLSFYNNTYDIGPSIDAASVAGLLGGQPALYDPTAFQHDTENVYGEYAQYGGAYGRLSWLTGVRVESTFGVYRGFILGPDASGNTVATPNVYKHDYSEAFPSLQLKYALTPAMDARAIYSTAIARPGFNQITPGTTVSVTGPTVTTGNPNLNTTYSNAFDLVWEDYLRQGGKISLAGFDKEFNTYIFPSLTIGTYPQTLLPAATIFNITSFSNSGAARVYGVEAEYTQQFLFLPAPWNGLGFDSNLTYNQSEATITRDNGQGVQASETLQLPSTSPWNFNVAIFYEKYPFDIRLAGNYVSKNLYSLGTTKQADIYSQQRFRLDLGTAYNINRHFQLYLDGHNLTDQTLKFTETASAERPTQREFYGVDILGGVRVTY